MTTHTPGPWHVESGDEVRAADGWEVAYIYGASRQRVDWEANARLIAAAPELLEALEAITANASWADWRDLDQILNARAAIAKAKGETP